MFRPQTAIVAVGCLMGSTLAASAAPAQVTTDLNLRSGRGTEFAVLTTVPEGATVDANSCDGAWCRTSYAGRVGYVSESYLSFGYAQAPVEVVPYDYGYGYSPWYGPNYAYGFGGGHVWRHRHHHGQWRHHPHVGGIPHPGGPGRHRLGGMHRGPHIGHMRNFPGGHTITRGPGGRGAFGHGTVGMGSRGGMGMHGGPSHGPSHMGHMGAGGMRGGHRR
jgi:uncharacterized protein YraI